jgi:hypothetical protein
MDYDYTEHFSREQQKAAYELLEKINSCIHLQLLIAAVQSGKSGCYLFLACLLLHNKIVKKCVITSGMPDIDLKNQTLENKHEAIYKKFRYYLQDVLKIERKEIDTTLKMLNENLKIEWGNDIRKYKDDLSNTCFLIDECHYAQNKNMKIHKFFTSCGVSLNGENLDVLVNKNIYIVGISATPSSELSNYIHRKQEQYKSVVFLEPSAGYRGLGDFWRNGQIISYEPSDISAFSDLLTDLLSQLGENECGIIRVTSKERHLLVEEIAKRICIEVIDYNSETKKDELLGMKSLSELGRTLNKPTLYILLGMGRCGHVIPNKDKIRFVMETSNDPLTCTLVQGLPGRMCGYESNDFIQIFVPKKVMESGDIKKVIDLFENKNIHSIPNHDKNIVAPKQGNSKKRRISEDDSEEMDCFPILPTQILNFPLEKLEIPKKKSKSKTDAVKALKELIIEHLREKEKNETHNEPEILDNLIEQLEDEDSVFQISKINMDNTYSDVPKTIKETNESRIPKGLGSGCGSKYYSFRIFVFDCEMEGFPKGSVFLDGRTLIHPPVPQIIPGTNGKELYASAIINPKPRKIRKNQQNR